MLQQNNKFLFIKMIILTRKSSFSSRLPQDIILSRCNLALHCESASFIGYAVLLFATGGSGYFLSMRTAFHSLRKCKIKRS